MLVALIAAAEIAFWVVLAAGLGARYLLRRPRLGGGLLVCVPLIDVLLLTATVLDLRRGAEPSAAHGLAALYLGCTVAYGHYLIRWADGHAAHRLAGAPRPARPPRYGMARARHEWRVWRMTLGAVAIALAVLQAMVWLVADAAPVETLREWQVRSLVALGVHTAIAGSYTVWPKREPRPAPPPPPAGAGDSAAPAPGPVPGDGRAGAGRGTAG